VRTLVVTFTVLIILLSLVASLAGSLSHELDRYRTVTTPRGEVVEVADAGIYRYSARALVTAGTPWDVVRLLMGIPVLLVSFIFHLRGSLRGTVLFVGSLASFLYQYLLWTFDWAFNSLFLVYVAIFSLSLWTLVFVLAGIDGAQVRAAIGKRFPVKTAASFSFVLSAMLVLKCLGEILPSVGSTAMPAGATGYYTMVDQALDLGLLAPFGIVTGVLLLRRESLGYLLSSSSLILFLSVGLSVIAGEVMLGLSAGRINVAGIGVFALLVFVALALLIRVLTSISRRE
jgi:hypothetical protein